MVAPTGAPCVSNITSRYLPCRELLLFRSVLAQPKLSSSGLVARTMSLMLLMPVARPSPETAAMYCMMRLAASVFPAPDSPEMITHWLSL